MPSKMLFLRRESLRDQRGLSHLIALTMGLWLGGTLMGHAGLSWMGNGYLELSSAQNSPGYYGNGGTYGSTFTLGQTLYLGGQSQTWMAMPGVTVTMFYRVGNSGSFNSINLSYYQTANNNDWWDSNGALNYNHTYISVNVGSQLQSGNNTIQYYYSATDGSSLIYDGSASSPWSVTVNAVVPEPVTMALSAFGGLWLIAWSARKFPCCQGKVFQSRR